MELSSEQLDKEDLLLNGDLFGLLSKSLKPHGAKLAQMADDYKAQFLSELHEGGNQICC